VKNLFTLITAKHIRQKKGLRILTIVLLFLVGLNAVAAGYAFMTDPSGNGIGISTEYIRHSPFRDFFIPGLVLFIIIGLLSIVTAVATMAKAIQYSRLIFLQGVLLCGWIVIQMIMVRDFNWMHLVCLVIGISLMIIAKKLKVQL
jgi:hypothetical protein